MAKHRIWMKKWWWSPFIWIVEVALKGVRDCIVLTKMKAMSLYLLYLFGKMLPMQFFWYIGQIVLDLCRNSKYLIRYLLWWHKILLGAIWTQTYSEPLQASKIECFADTVNGWKTRLVQGVQNKSPRCFYVKCNIFLSYVYIIYFVFYMFWSISMVVANIWLRKVRFENLWNGSV